MSNQSLHQNPTARNGHAPAGAFTQAFCPYEGNRINQLNTQQALTVAAHACNSILFGEPHTASFDRADLSQTLAILTQMAITIEPTGGEV